MWKVYDYKDISKIDSIEQFTYMKNGVIITATADLAKGMGRRYGCLNVYDIHEIQKMVIPEWDFERRLLDNYIALHNILESYEGKIEENLSISLERNVYDIWNAIVLLMSADVQPDDIIPGTDRIAGLFKAIWKELEIQQEGLRRCRTLLDITLKEPAVFLRRINEICREGNLFVPSKSIFLIGFYYITPMQARIFDLLENAGMDLVFLNCHDEEYPLAGKIWEHTFSEEYSKGVKNLQPGIHMENYFGSILEGRELRAAEVDEYVRLCPSRDEFEFADRINKAYQSNEAIFTADHKGCNQMLREFFPDMYSNKMLLSYPVGRYIFHLHQMWEPVSKSIEIRFETVRECFATGWVHEDELNGVDYLAALDSLKPCFQNIRKLEEWNEMVGMIKRAKSVLSPFEHSGSSESRDRFHRMLQNPFANFAFYNINEECLEDVTVLLTKLCRDVSTLFGNGGQDLYRHLKMLSSMLEQTLEEASIAEEERVVAYELISRFKDVHVQKWQASMNTIRDAVLLLLGSHDEEEGPEEESEDRQEMARAFSQIEALPLLDVAQKNMIHIVSADVDHLPGKKSELPWPLKESIINNLDIGDRPDVVKYVNAMQSIVENQSLSNRYLFFSAFSNVNSRSDIKISIEWISQRDNKKIAPTPYASMMNIKEDERSGRIVQTSCLDSVSKELYRPEEIHISNKTVPEEVRMDYTLCKKKYLYSYLLNEMPTFKERYQCELALSRLVTIISRVSEVDFDTVKGRTFSLFPFLREVEKSQAEDWFGRTIKLKGTTDYKGVEYPKERWNLHYLLTNREIEKLIKTLSGKAFSTDSHKICATCPYGGFCDKEKRSDTIND